MLILAISNTITQQSIKDLKASVHTQYWCREIQISLKIPKIFFQFYSKFPIKSHQ